MATHQTSSDHSIQQRHRRSAVDRMLDELQAQGLSLVTIDELARGTGLTLVATRRQMEHLSHRYARIQGKPAAYLLVPPEHRSRGAPPVTWWLDAYFRLRNQPYYIGLLSAAEIHGSSQQAVQVTQVLTVKPMRPIEVGILRLEFYVKKNLTQTPVMQPPGLHAPLAISSPEATALDLIAYSHRIGGIDRAAHVIAGMKPSMTIAGLSKALRAETESAVKQRLGYVFQVLGWEKQATEVQRHLTGKLTPAVLQPRAETLRGAMVLPWRVIDNVDLKDRLE